MLGLEVPPLRSERRESRDSLVAATTTSYSPVALAWCPSTSGYTTMAANTRQAGKRHPVSL